MPRDSRACRNSAVGGRAATAHHCAVAAKSSCYWILLRDGWTRLMIQLPERETLFLALVQLYTRWRVYPNVGYLSGEDTRRSDSILHDVIARMACPASSSYFTEHSCCASSLTNLFTTTSNQPPARTPSLDGYSNSAYPILTQ